MSYGTTMNFFMRIKNDVDIQELEETVEEKIQHPDFIMWDDLSVSNFNIPNPTHYNFELNEYYRSWVRDAIDDLCKFVAPYVVKDSSIECSGDESSDLWRVIFDGKGNYKIQEGVVLYGDQFEDFLIKYGEKMPPALVRELEKWQMLMKI